ncbi:MAG: hypothetical protein ACRD0M_08785, partial [Acidimicrobiales bacterium]
MLTLRRTGAAAVPPAGLPAPVGTVAPSRRHAVEAGAAILLLVVVGAVAFGRHVVSGGFYNDDWYLAANFQFAPGPWFVGGMRALDWMA